MNSEFYTSIDRYGNNILYRGYNADGTQLLKRVKFKPKLYMPDKDCKHEYKSIYGESLKPIYFDSMSDMKQFVDMYSDVASFKYYGFDRHPVSFIQHKFPNEIKYDKRIINVMNFDIETEVAGSFPNPNVAAEEIRAISASCSRDGKVHVFAFKPGYKPARNVEFHLSPDEPHMLEDFLNWYCKPFYMPDVITGWNIDTFDIPFLVNRIYRMLGEDSVKRLSPWNSVSKRKITAFGREQDTFEFMGVQQLDYMNVFKKFGGQTYGNQESYSLNHISHIVLGESKLDYSDIGSLNELYEQDFQRFIDYNVKDVELINRMEAKLGYLDIVYTLAYMAGVNYVDTMKTTPVWDAIIFRRLARINVIPPSGGNHLKASFPGGYVKEPQVGMHNWVMSFDFASLYPNLIIQHNMSPETLTSHKIDLDPNDIIAGQSQNTVPNTAMAANGHTFRTDKIGVIPELMRELYSQRKIVKTQLIEKKKELESTSGDTSNLKTQISLLNNMQMAIKILLNSGYGAISNTHFRYFDLRIAEAITLSGQYYIQYAESVINKELASLLNIKKDYVIAMDTDSIVGESVIEVGGKKLTIAEYYDSLNTKFLKADCFNEQFVKEGDYALTPSISADGHLQKKSITSVMKHKVKKQMFRIYTKHGSVDLTDDHSIIVKNLKTGLIEEKKPSQLNMKIHRCINIINAKDTDKPI